MGIFGFKRTIGAEKEPEPGDLEGNAGMDQGQFFEKMTGMLDKIMERQDQLQAKILEVDQRAQGTQASQGMLKPTEDNAPARKRLSDYSQEELDELMPTDVYKIMQEDMQEQFKKVLDERVTPVADTLKGFMNQTHQGQVRDRVMSLAQEKNAEGELVRPDLADWYEEIRSLRQQMPGVDVEKLYNLARISNPEKAKSLDAKYRPTPAPSKQDNVLAFGGLAPDLMRRTEDGGDLSVPDAASKALQEIREQYGELPSAGSM